MGATQSAQPDNLALPFLPDDYGKRQIGSGVRVKVQIGMQGGAGVVTLARSCGDKELDAAVLDAIAAWRWTPALKKGEPIASTCRSSPTTWRRSAVATTIRIHTEEDRQWRIV